MSSLRRKTSVSPITVVRSALVCNPIAHVAAPAESAFSDVLVKVISAPQSVDWAHAYQEQRDATREANATAQPQSASIAVTSWSPNSNNSTDLYIQLDTLLRHKSLLIGIA